jgi:hypothetical protein
MRDSFDPSDDIKKLNWAIELSRLDLKSLRDGDWLNLKEDLYDFVFVGWPVGGNIFGGTEEKEEFNKKVTSEFVSRLQAGLRDKLQSIAAGGNAKSEPLSFHVSGDIYLFDHPRRPYTQIMIPHELVTRFYCSFLSRLVRSGIVKGQLRACPECHRIHLLKRKPRSDRESYCSRACSTLVASRHYRERHASALKVEERKRSRHRYENKQRQRFGLNVKVDKRPRKH